MPGDHTASTPVSPSAAVVVSYQPSIGGPLGPSAIAGDSLRSEEIAEQCGCHKDTVSQACRKVADLPEPDEPAADHLTDFDVPPIVFPADAAYNPAQGGKGIPVG